MVESDDAVLLQEYELLIGANLALERGDHKSYESFLSDIQRDLKEEYLGNLNEKIDRWLDVTRVMHFREVRPVEFYMQAKLLYRDGFYEAAIMLARSTAEMICYDMLQNLSHPFGNQEEIERQNFRRLANFLFDDARHIDERIYTLLNHLYDIGNNYVHPKANTQAKLDARKCMMLLGECIDRLYGVRYYKVGTELKNAYASFPDVCRGMNFGIVFFKTPALAERDSKRWGFEVDESFGQRIKLWRDMILCRFQTFFEPRKNRDSK